MSIDGTSGADLLSGTSGSDTINGFGADDTLYGLAGNDLINGGAGNDYLAAGVAFAPDNAVVGFDTLSGGEGDDTLEASEAVQSPPLSGGVFDGGIGTDRVILRGGFFIPSYDATDPSTDFKINTYPGGGGSPHSHTLVDIEIVEFIGSWGNPNYTFELGVGTGGANSLAPALTGLSFYAFGGAGADTLTGGSLDDSLTGDGGDDSLVGAVGVDTLVGGAGVDTLAGGAGADSFYIDRASDIAGAGDAISDLSTEDEILLNLGGFQFETLHFIGTAAFSGTGQELRFQTVGGQTLIELDDDGDGTADGRITITNGAFSLRWSDEFFNSFQIAVVASATGGADTIRGTVGDDILDGVAGDDRLIATLGDDTATGGLGDDAIYGGEGADVMTGGAGADLFGWSYNYELGSTAGVVTDVITDLDPIDQIYMPLGFLTQLAADYSFLSWIGTASFSGNAGEYRYEKFAGRTEVQIDINGDAAADHIINITNGAFDLWAQASNRIRIVSGAATAGDDSLAGTNGANSIDGLLGSDFIDGLGGDDTLVGGAGADTLYGDTGSDSIKGDAGGDSLRGWYGDDFIDGGADNDILIGDLGSADALTFTGGSDTLVGGDGNDTLRGGGGNDRLFAGLGNDRADGGFGDDFARTSNGRDTALGGDGDDTLGAGSGNDLLNGGLGADFLLASNGNDRLYGGAGNDTMLGGGGRDTLTGGAGDDRLVGGSENDGFNFNPGSGADLIVDFAAGAASGDVIRLIGWGAAFDAFSDILAASTQVGANVVIDLGAGDSVTLQGVTLANLNAGDFAFG